MLLELTFSALSALGLLSPMAETKHLAADARLEAAGGLSIPVKADLPAGAKLSFESRVGRVLVQQSIRKEPAGRLDRSAAAMRKAGEGDLQPSFFSGAACAGALANSAAAPASAFEVEPSALVRGPGPEWRGHCPEHELRLAAICARAEPRPFKSAMRGATELDRCAGVWSNSPQRPASRSTADGSAVNRRSRLSAPVGSGQWPSTCYALAAPSVPGIESLRLPGPSGPSPANPRGV